ncbi:hypothetical protein AAFF_G00235620 [Aldrovandia affinis]|uniref:Uncharacterized protein n=1 Tax=Aldrovandia affinis TaxID=143900 RepID=A0AAD7WV23_9TELE|nr:hypothetical protein AAFF_G00235620 [Aldrovandia affinis]
MDTAHYNTGEIQTQLNPLHFGRRSGTSPRGPGSGAKRGDSSASQHDPGQPRNTCATNAQRPPAQLTPRESDPAPAQLEHHTAVLRFPDDRPADRPLTRRVPWQRDGRTNGPRSRGKQSERFCGARSATPNRSGAFQEWERGTPGPTRKSLHVIIINTTVGGTQPQGAVRRGARVKEGRVFPAKAPSLRLAGRAHG